MGRSIGIIACLIVAAVNAYWIAHNPDYQYIWGNWIGLFVALGAAVFAGASLIKYP